MQASPKALRDGLALHHPNSEITYSVKTSYLTHILRQVLAYNAGASPTQLLFNGPVKSPEDLEYRCFHSISLNFNSFEELQSAACDGSLFAVNPLRSTIHPPCHLVPQDLKQPGPNAYFIGSANGQYTPGFTNCNQAVLLPDIDHPT